MSLTTDQLQEATKLYAQITGSLSSAVGTGTWYAPTEGLDQIIYPDAYPEDTTNTVYYPFYQVANSYAAYNPEQKSNLTYLTSNQEDPVSSDGSTAIVQQNSSLNDVVRNMYQSMVFGLSASDQAQQAKYKETLETMATYVAGELEDSFKLTGDYAIVTDSENNFFASGTDPFSVIDGSINYILNNLIYYANSFNTEGNMYAQYLNTFAPDDGIINTNSQGFVTNPLITNQQKVNEYVSWATNYMMQGGFNLSDEMNSSYGPLVQQGRGFSPAYGNPWTSTIYSTFSDVSTNVPTATGSETIYGITSTAGQAYANLQSRVNTNAVQLQNLISYLSNYVSLTTPGISEGSIAKINTASYNSVVEGYPNAPEYAIPYTSTALSGAQTGNDVQFELSTSGSSSTNQAQANSTDVSWSAGGGFSGWFFGASASTQGSSSNSQEWSSFDSTATNVSVTSVWSDVTSKSIQPAPSWFLAEAINQAWTSGMTADNINYEGGYAFISPDQANQFVTANLYYISGIAYGTPKNVIKGSTDEASSYSDSSYSSFQTETKASAGYGWGPWSFGASSSVSTSSESSASSFTGDESSSSFEITNEPLTGLEPLSYAGTPSGLVGITLKAVGTAMPTIAPGETSTSLSSSLSEVALSSNELNRKKYTKIIVTAETNQKSTEANPYDLSGASVTFFGNNKGKDYITGGNGNDTVYGMGGKDVVDMGKGKDMIWPGMGKSTITGGGGRDIVYFRRDYVEQEGKYFHKMMDWGKKDRLAINGYTSSEVIVKRADGGSSSRLFLGGERVAKFVDTPPDVLQILVEEAHFSIYA